MNEKKLVRILKSLQLFAQNFLIIHDKQGIERNFVFNRAQRYIHERLEQQLKETGRVRAIILKGRQQGVSTYVQARYFHHIVTQKGQKAFILTHLADATRSIFDMTKRFSEKLPREIFILPDKNNDNTLMYHKLSSGYRVGTAGNENIGRSMTNQYLHLSEYAFYKKAEAINLGLMQTVADLPKTEIIKESTANGTDNDFYLEWMLAKNGATQYQAIFVPWYWQDEYTADVSNLDLTDEEKELLLKYKDNGLTINHLAWRRNKLMDFKGDYEQRCRKFRQEYPFSDDEAFLSSTTDAFIRPEHVIAARSAQVESDSALVIGVDPARMGDDRTAIIRRRGRLAYKLETHYSIDTMQLVSIIKNIINNEKPRRVCIDSIGIGAGVVDRLIELGYDMVEGVNVARRADEPDKYKNLRAQLWSEMRDWFLQEMPVQIPDSDELQTDLTVTGYRNDSSDRLVIESKESVKKRGCLSTDCADALMLTFFGGQYVTDGAYKTRMLPEKVAGMLV